MSYRLIISCGVNELVVANPSLANLSNTILGKFGRLGTGNERNCHTPHLVEAMVGKRPKQVSCGGFHTAVVTEGR